MILLSILSLLISNAVIIKRETSILFNRIAIIILIYCILHDFTSLIFLTKNISLHGGLLYVTSLVQIFHIFIFIISILILQLTSFFPKNYWIPEFSSLNYIFSTINKKIKFSNKMIDHLKIIEYPLILLFIISGAIFLISTNDLISIFLSIELQSYGLYLLSTIYRNSEVSTTAGLIYFLLGGLSSCFILLGTSLLYVNSGTTNMDNFYIIININDLNNNINTLYQSYYINFSLLIFSIGFLFKVSAAPFHFWSPDVYDAIPTIVTTFVAIIAKISIFIFLLELIYYTNNLISKFNWTFGLLISSFFSLIVGTVAGLTQFRIKKLLAYSTISHVGFILLALSIPSIESTQAFIFYLIQYTISNLNIFIILIAIGYYYYNTNNKIFKEKYEELIDKYNSPIQLISQLKGYFYINPILSISLIITIFSFVGIPPLIGFFAKQMVLSAAINNGFIFITFIAISTSIIGGIYYLNIVKEICFYNSPLNNNKILFKVNNNNLLKDEKNIKISSNISITISIITLIILLYIFFNKEWLSMSTILVQILFNY